MLTRHSRTFIDFNYCTLYNFWDFGEVDPKNVDFLVTQSKIKKKSIDIARSRHFVRKNRFIHGPEIQNRLKGLAVTTNGAPRSKVGVGTLKVEPPGGTKESTGDQSKYLTEKYKH